MSFRQTAARAALGLTVALTLGASETLLVMAGDQNVTIIAPGQYQPSSVQVDPGQAVTWTNQDSSSHNATCAGPPDCPVSFQSGNLMGQGKSGTYTFQYSGTYSYTCAAHRTMSGTVVVTGNVRPPSSGSGGGSGSSSSGPGSGAPASTSNSGNSATRPPPAAAGAAAAPPTGRTAPGSATVADPGTAGSAAEVKQALAGINLPRPNVTVTTPASQGTPRWVMFAAAAALVVCAVLFGFAWFGPPIRPGGSRARSDA